MRVFSWCCSKQPLQLYFHLHGQAELNTQLINVHLWVSSTKRCSGLNLQGEKVETLPRSVNSDHSWERRITWHYPPPHTHTVCSHQSRSAVTSHIDWVAAAAERYSHIYFHPISYWTYLMWTGHHFYWDELRWVMWTSLYLPRAPHLLPHTITTTLAHPSDTLWTHMRNTSIKNATKYFRRHCIGPSLAHCTITVQVALTCEIHLKSNWNTTVLSLSL